MVCIAAHSIRSGIAMVGLQNCNIPRCSRKQMQPREKAMNQMGALVDSRPTSRLNDIPAGDSLSLRRCLMLGALAGMQWPCLWLRFRGTGDGRR